MGKESNKIEETSVLGVSPDDLMIYSDKAQGLEFLQTLFDKKEYKDFQGVDLKEGKDQEQLGKTLCELKYMSSWSEF